MSAVAESAAPPPDGDPRPATGDDRARGRAALAVAPAPRRRGTTDGTPGAAPAPDPTAAGLDPAAPRPERSGAAERARHDVGPRAAVTPGVDSPTVRPVDVRLAPRTEPTARPLRASAPAHVVPPRLGSPEAAQRGRAAARPAYPGVAETPPGPLPDPTPLCCAMVQAAVEGLRGVRPLAQLTGWVTPEVYETLRLRAELVQEVGGPATSRAGIRRIRLFRIGDEVAEAGVVVDDGPRVRAVAVRLEAHRGRWRAVAMEIG